MNSVFHILTTVNLLLPHPVQCCPFLEIHTTLITKGAKSYFISKHSEEQNKVEWRVICSSSEKFRTSPGDSKKPLSTVTSGLKTTTQYDPIHLLIIHNFTLLTASILVHYPKLVVTFLIVGCVLYIDTSL